MAPLGPGRAAGGRYRRSVGHRLVADPKRKFTCAQCGHGFWVDIRVRPASLQAQYQRITAVPLHVSLASDCAVDWSSPNDTRDSRAV
jgi:hypothetical protein